MAGEPLVGADETAPLRPDSRAPYPATKARAEQAVREAARDDFETVVLRPRFVWGKGDTTLLPEMVATAKPVTSIRPEGGRALSTQSRLARWRSSSATISLVWRAAIRSWRGWAPASSISTTRSGETSPARRPITTSTSWRTNSSRALL